MKFLGIDPGLATVGIGRIEASSKHDIRAIDWLTIETKAGGGAAHRLAEIAQDLSALLNETAPDIAVVEKLFFAANEKSALDVAQARGVILQLLAEHGIPIVEPTPVQMKSVITGDGRADKRQVQDMLARTLHLQEIPKPDDAADALALAVYGALVHTF
ncbi:MAG: crossover junction endodeoxyribonuclease RuvC [Candidatus Peribacteraceae bacterium]|nr:crossover junction endodeoxyribonuclease RuvC [Candidatus Peribacteraceae bacterium]